MLEHGGQLRAVAARYGIPLQQWLDLSTGINPVPFAPPQIPLDVWARLPQEQDGLETAAAAYYGTADLLPVCGTQAAIQALPRLRTHARVGVLHPGYAEHGHAWRNAGHDVTELTTHDIDAQIGGLDVLVLMQPNNPTGTIFTLEQLRDWHNRLVARGGWLVVDEAFIDVSNASIIGDRSTIPTLPPMGEGPGFPLLPGEGARVGESTFTIPTGLIVLRSLGKFFGLAGARVGFVLAHAAVLTALRELLGPWSVAGPARFVAQAALLDRAWQSATRERLLQDGARLAQLLRAAGLPPAGGCSLFQWVPTAHAEVIHQQLAQHGILIRLFAQPPSLRFGLPANEADWDRLRDALKQYNDSFPHPRSPSDETTSHSTKPASGQAAGYPEGRGVQSVATRDSSLTNARTLMIQGTTSDAGKSAVVAGLCRVLKRCGVSVAPFKPQNMALNSAVTADGGEIGRAQAVQAQAAGLEPHTDMNPVLLKPNSDTGAQVIIHGHAVGNMEAAAYHGYKQVAREAVLQSHARLASQYQTIIVEGAGSPAEINLRANDIANMGFAEEVDCPVLLVADIDRGGVFAHLAGTLALLSTSEQARVQGFIINRFRGNLALLQPGLDWLEQYTGKKVLGVLPYLHGLHLEAEDALPARNTGTAQDKLRVVVPALPHISNHTDFDPLRLHPQVSLHWVAPNEIPPSADWVILPGSKNVRADLGWLRAHGWEQYLARHLRYGGKLMGICGGLQMLGTTLRDPHGIEGDPGESAGLGYLDMVTVLQPHKQLHNVQGTLTQSGAPVSGYEIHAGVSEGGALRHPFAQLADGRCDGAISADGQIIATYLHGVFESPQALAELLRWVGLQAPQAFDYHALREQNLERLADTLEAHLDMKRILQLLGENK